MTLSLLLEFENHMVCLARDLFCLLAKVNEFFIVEVGRCAGRVGMIIPAFCLDFVIIDMRYQLNYVQGIFNF